MLCLFYPHLKKYSEGGGLKNRDLDQERTKTPLFLPPDSRQPGGV